MSIELKWRKSTFSGGNGGNCVEVAQTVEGVLVRNSKRPEQEPMVFTKPEIEAWIAGCKAGEFDDLV